ncbi:acetyltransferase [Arthrobacter phage MaGuCo]|uniref:Acetyltransferase n=1 Tax=Arthrobacter phage MaGuCo TaxID=3038363 RepID=A0AAF0K706_9CAUD|nr:acetyltransferase [Arthrobacter phage MaGuCo]
MDSPATAPPPFAELTVAPVDYATAKKMIVENHYSKKWNTAFGTVNFGVFWRGDLLGVAVYGNAMNPSSWGRVTETDPAKCLELNRLWIDDALGHNTETWLMGQTFRQLRAMGYELVQSFADGRLGVGTIYQAANFGYYGFHETQFHRDNETGEVYHTAPFSNTAVPGAMLDRNYLFTLERLDTIRVRTYRYLYPLTRRARKAVRLRPVAEYPKERAGEIDVPDYVPPAAQIARSVLIADALGDPRGAELLGYLRGLTDDADAVLAAQRENRFIRGLYAKLSAADVRRLAKEPAAT